MTPSSASRARPALEALAVGAVTAAVAGFSLRGLAAGVLVAVAFFLVLLRRARELERVRDGVAQAARGLRPEEGTGLAGGTEDVVLALHRFADLVARERQGSEKERLLARTVFEEVPVGLVVVDRGLALLDVNPAARELFSVPSGAPCAALHDLVRDPGVLTLFSSLAGGGSREGGPVLTKVTGRERGERLLEIAARAMPGVPAAGEPAAIGVVADVTERERTEGMRRQFVADVSHELRTPIATVRAAAEALADDASLGVDAGRFAGIVLRQATGMQELVSDLTDLAQIESGSITLQLETLPVAGLLASVTGDLESFASSRNVTVALEADPALVVRGDRRRLAQVFRNLVDNAVKFSPQGGRVDVRAEAAAGKPQAEVLVHVVDRGIGIPASEQSKIFQRFYRVDPSRSKSTPGTGLGLAIVKHLLVLHGGSIRVESQPLSGSRFTVSLPAAPAADVSLREAS